MVKAIDEFKNIIFEETKKMFVIYLNKKLFNEIITMLQVKA